VYLFARDNGTGGNALQAWEQNSAGVTANHANVWFSSIETGASAAGAATHVLCPGRRAMGHGGGGPERVRHV
jgi:hypothetical protein